MKKIFIIAILGLSTIQATQQPDAEKLADDAAHATQKQSSVEQKVQEIADFLKNTYKNAAPTLKKYYANVEPTVTHYVKPTIALYKKTTSHWAEKALLYMWRMNGEVDLNEMRDAFKTEETVDEDLFNDEIKACRHFNTLFKAKLRTFAKDWGPLSFTTLFAGTIYYLWPSRR